MAEIHVQAKKHQSTGALWIWIVVVILIAAAAIYFFATRNNNGNQNNTQNEPKSKSGAAVTQNFSGNTYVMSSFA
jgi:flagellar basal body-associated protein FliL